MFTATIFVSHRIMLSAFLCLTSSFCLQATAATFHITTTADTFDGICDSDCSLRDAINSGNQIHEEHTIYLQAATYVLTRPRTEIDDSAFAIEYFDDEDASIGDLDIRQKFRITGTGSATTVIDAKKLDRHFSISPQGALTLTHLTLINGKNSQMGGSILNKGVTNLHSVVLLNNMALSSYHPGNGGAISNFGELKIQRCDLVNNLASFGDTSLTYGGAIYNEGNAYVRDSAFRNNQASTDDVISYGGAIYNSGNADIARSLFTGNYTQGGGMAIFNANTMKLTNSTLSQNTGDIYDLVGALNNDGTLELKHTSIVYNFLGAGFINRGSAYIRNSIILNNLSGYPDEEYPPAPINCYNSSPASQFKARGLLLGEGNTKCAGEIYVADSDTFTHVLAPLAQNNYHLETHALLPNSPAIDAGIGSCSSHDQRWLPRPADGNADGVANCDLGAFELQPSP